MPKRADMINHPPHYTASAIEPLDVIEAWELGYHLGCVVKYIARHRHKGAPLQDLQKARAYLDRKIAQLEGDPEAAFRARLPPGLWRPPKKLPRSRARRG